MLILGEYFSRKEMEPLKSDWGNKETQLEMQRTESLFVCTYDFEGEMCFINRSFILW